MSKRQHDYNNSSAISLYRWDYYWVVWRMLIVLKRQHDQKVAKNTFLARSTVERCKHQTTSSLVSSMIAALWAFTGETIIELFGGWSYVQRTGVTGITEHYAEKQTRWMILTPEREYITKTTRYLLYAQKAYNRIVCDDSWRIQINAYWKLLNCHGRCRVPIRCSITTAILSKQWEE